jgi:hypothetical protein
VCLMVADGGSQWRMVAHSGGWWLVVDDRSWWG